MHSNKKIELISEVYNDLIANYYTYLKSLGLKDNTISGNIILLKKFLNYLIKNNITLVTLDNDLVFKFVELNSIGLSSAYKSSSMFYVRRIINFLHNFYNYSTSGDELFPVIKTNKRDKLLSFYSLEEIQKIICIIDRNTIKGKRDFAIILLLSETGMRSGDLVRLKFENIHWDSNYIEFVQQKTGKYNQVAIGNELKYAIIDYLKNARPHYKSDYIFIGAKNKGTNLSNSQIASIVQNAFKKANIAIDNKKHCAHALRHSLANNLITANTPMPVIQSVLGHSSINTTQIYLNIDYESLKKLALELPNEK